MAARFSPRPRIHQGLTGLARIWADLVAAGWGKSVLRYATHGLLLGVLALAIWARQLNLGFIDWFAARATLNPAGAPTLVNPERRRHARASRHDRRPATTPARRHAAPPPDGGSQVDRLADGHTFIPTRGRSEVITYTVAAGDTLFGIADKFGLKPESNT